MNKSVLIPLGLLLLSSLQAAEKDKSWDDLDETCFNKSARIKAPAKGTVKINVSFHPHIFFVQNRKVLPSRILEYGTHRPLKYTVLSVQGTASGKLQNTQHLHDGNYQTSLDFDPYSNEKPEVKIDMGTLLQPENFVFNINYRGNLKVRYFVSRENKKYIEVTQPQSHTWRYLKLQFETYKQQDTIKYPVSIRELNISTQASAVYIINAETEGLIDMFTGFECDDEDFGKLYNQTITKARKTRYRLSAKTRTYDVNLKVNPKYNTDFDGDGVLNGQDNCPFHKNSEQQDIDRDFVGDECDYNNEVQNFHEKDYDRDGVGDSMDNCVYIYNPRQMDSNADKKGDLCSDDDNDGVIGHQDNCIDVPNRGQEDINVNGVGDACEFDNDKDGIFNSIDNCIGIKNSHQEDEDKDGIGDACDNCSLYNPDQRDQNQNGKGDRCETHEQFVQKNDKDGDGVLDSEDNCPMNKNRHQEDKDKDGVGDLCDNCPELQNPGQIDKDSNLIGDLCEDSDKDGIIGYLDNCVHHANPGQKDSDNDGTGDDCEDDDHDGIAAAEDNCPFTFNKDQWDNDRDGIGDKCDDKDDRLLESNRWIVTGIIVLITAAFGFLIMIMIKKIKKDTASQP